MDEQLLQGLIDTGISEEDARIAVEGTRQFREADPESAQANIDRFISNKEAQNNNEVISTSQVQPSREIVPAEQIQPTAADAIFEATTPAEQRAEAIVSDQAQREADLRERQEDLESLMLQAFRGQADVLKEERRLGEELGLEGQIEARDVQRERVDQLNRQRTNLVRDIQDEPGLTATQKNAQIQEVDRKFARQIADEEIILNSRQRDVERTQNSISRKIELLTEESRIKLETTKFFFESNQQALTRAEQNLFQLKIAQDERAFNKEVQDTRDLETRKFAIVNDALVNGAPPNLASQAMAADTLEEALQLVGGYMGLMQRMSFEASRSAAVSKRVAAAQEEQDALKATADGAMDISRLIQDLRNPERSWFGLLETRKFATGFTSLLPSIPGTQGRNYTRTHEQLKKNLTREGLSALRGLGAMSDRELGLIEDSVSKLSLDLPEKEYLAELQIIQDNLQPTFDAALGSGLITPEQYGVAMGLDDQEAGFIASFGATLQDQSAASFYDN